MSESSNDPLIPVFIPPLVQILAMKERDKGAPLTEAEVLEIFGKGVCMMLSLSQATKLAEGRGFNDITPANVWAEWQAMRNNWESA